MRALLLADAAEQLVGAPFRLHGRTAATGLDCIGVLAVSLEAIGCKAPLPSAYSLRARRIPGLSMIAMRCGFNAVSGALQPGDALLARVGACQFHLFVTARCGRLIHAHAGVGRVIIEPMPQNCIIAGHWRLPDQD